MTWIAVVREQTGEAVSFASIAPDTLPAGCVVVPIDHQTGTGERWDPATRAVVAHTAAEQIAELESQRDAIEDRMVALGARVVQGERPTRPA